MLDANQSPAIYRTNPRESRDRGGEAPRASGRGREAGDPGAAALDRGGRGELARPPGTSGRGRPSPPGGRGSQPWTRRSLRPGALLLAALSLVVPAAARAQVVAVLQGLDKTTARISTITAPVGVTVSFGALRI